MKDGAPHLESVPRRRGGADVGARIEASLAAAVARSAAGDAPPLLAAAIRDAVFPGGARVRPRLCVSVARACGDDDPDAADAAAAALELLHCASLAHDDLPCFDDAETRRGKPSLHCAFGEPVALLAGDALIVLAFETLALGAARSPSRLAALTRMVAAAVGAPRGIVAGQAWESEPEGAIEVDAYHRAKTGALFVGAVSCGALAAGADPAPWRGLGERLGEAYQVADDILDATAGEAETGKPVGRDAALDRPSAVAELGLDGAVSRLKLLVGEAVDSVPDCVGADELRALVAAQAKRLTPQRAGRPAA